MSQHYLSGYSCCGKSNAVTVKVDLQPVLRIGAQLLQSALFCTARVHGGGQVKGKSNRSCAMKAFGGRGRDRTGDPLLAKQVLSQLSYTPTIGITIILNHFSQFQNPFPIIPFQ